MIHLKNNGFTLIEVLLAMALVGVVLAPIFSLQSTILNRVLLMTNKVHRMFIAYDFFLDTTYTAKKTDDKGITKKIDEPTTDLNYEVVDVPKDSILKKDFNHLSFAKLVWTWQDQNKKQSDEFVSVVFKPPAPKKTASNEKQKDAQANKKTVQQSQQNMQQKKKSLVRGGKK